MSASQERLKELFGASSIPVKRDASSALSGFERFGLFATTNLPKDGVLNAKASDNTSNKENDLPAMVRY